MRIIPFLISSIVTVGVVVALNVPLPVGTAKTPCLGAFLSPQQGFWQNAEFADNDYNVALTFPNMEGKVQVYFDDRLVPHVYAEKENDAYFVQGYLHAKFRLWQMEFQTHAAAGRLSEIMGAKSAGTDFLKIDRFFRRLGMVYAAEKSLESLEADSTTKTELDAYTAGVNAYIAALKPNQFPIEYKLLNYQPEKWTNLKTQLFLKYMCFDLAGYDTDFEKTNVKSILSATDFEHLYPSTQDSLDPIIPRGTVFAKPAVIVNKPAVADSFHVRPTYSDSSNNILQPDKSNGSNNWAVSGSKTKSGAPILCNDPHLGLNLPSLWYEMQISTPTFNAYGVSFPGSPSIIIGFNDSIAWGLTNSERDVKDYYEIEFKDSAMQEYMYNGRWTATTFRDEIITVKDSGEVHEKIAMTVFGPVMYDRHYPDILKNGKYYALRWKAHDASNELLTFNRLNHAKNYVDYITAISTFQTPGQNFVFASKSGDIAIKQQGLFPAKWKGQGDILMPGTDSVFQWQGYIPVNENPKTFNPERGFVSSANQLPADETYPYYLGGEPMIYRGIAINRKLNQMSSITVEDMQLLQTDNYNVFAEMARPVLLKYLNESNLPADEIKYLDQLKNWNLKSDFNETGPTIFQLWWDSLSHVMYKDELSKTDLPILWPDQSVLLEGLLKDSVYKFADDITTPAVETIADMVLLSWKAGVKEIKKSDAEGRLAWGKFKDTGVRHLLKLPSFSRLHLPIGGGANIINATKSNHGPSWRMIVQLSAETEAYGVYPGGQSGNPGSKYYDGFIDDWAAGKYYPLLFVGAEAAAKDDKMKWKMTFEKA